MIVYDTEVIRPPVEVKTVEKGTYEQANGWDDFVGMGLAVLCAYNYTEDNMMIWQADMPDQKAWDEIMAHMQYNGVVIGYNNKKFDDRLLRAHGICIDEYNSYDILLQLWYAVGLNGEYDPRTHGGYSLDAVCRANFEGVKKSMHGAMAPILWQQGHCGRVVKYCVNDVLMTKMLVDKIFETGGLIDPKSKQHVKLALPRD